MKKTKTVAISTEMHKFLKELAASEGGSVPMVLNMLLKKIKKRGAYLDVGIGTANNLPIDDEGYDESSHGLPM